MMIFERIQILPPPQPSPINNRQQPAYHVEELRISTTLEMGETTLLVSPISFMIIPMFIRRVGLFILIVGLLILLVSIAFGKPNSQSLTMFCIGIPLMILGGTLWYRNRERSPAERFRTLRRFSPKRGEEDE